jgi:hypothetical protein
MSTASLYRTHHLTGTDLNRLWLTPDSQRHPVVFAAKTLVDSFSREPRILHGTFAHGCPTDDVFHQRAYRVCALCWFRFVVINGRTPIKMAKTLCLRSL